MGRFLAAAVPVWLLVTGIFLWLRQQEPVARLGLATTVTLLRGVFIGALAGCIPLPPRGLVAWAPGILYTSAALCDLLDGYLARRRGEESALGGRLDVALDALGLLVAPIAAVVLGRLPPWYLLLGAAYYLFQAALWLRRRRGLPLHEERLRPIPQARVFAGYQMGLVATALFPVLGPPGTSIAATLFMVPTLVLFGREWLVVTGRLEPRAEQRALAGGRVLLALALPVVRALVAGALVALVAGRQLPPIALAAAALLAAGVLTRLTAFATAIALCSMLPGGAALPLGTYLATMLLLLAGGGRGMLWNPEDRWLFMKAGTRPTPIED
jgi:CDP-diacylglycerol--glycerol-3-phosphate 3-phosphatidyltransferase